MTQDLIHDSPVEVEEVKEYRIFGTNGDGIFDNGTRREMLSQLQTDFPGDTWATVPADEVPEDWQNMQIKAGRIVKK